MLLTLSACTEGGKNWPSTTPPLELWTWSTAWESGSPIRCANCGVRFTVTLRRIKLLPLRQRVTLKLATLVHKCLNGQSPTTDVHGWLQTGNRRSGMRCSGDLETPHVQRAPDPHAATDHWLSHGQVGLSGTACFLSFGIRHCPVKDSGNR